MEKYYVVARIEGEYAYLRELDSEDEVFIAMALLPPGTDVGTKLKNEFFSYEIVE